jgi:thermostable 8-oxoguanine DNA glycosylase
MHLPRPQSNQSIVAMIGGELRSIELPPGRARIGLGKLEWGRADEICSPAYWSSQAWMWENEHPHHFKLGRTLREELLACLLGGYGIPAEVGLAAYGRLSAAHRADSEQLTDADRVISLLSKPLDVNGRRVRYRFATQKGRYVASALRGLDRIDDCADDTALRDALTKLPGVGLKTASWIVRNWRGSDSVSILDVHIVRAGRMLHLFEPSWRVERHYHLMEAAYLRFAAAIRSRASILDSVMWMTMRQLPPSLVKSFVAPGYEPSRTILHSRTSASELTAA